MTLATHYPILQVVIPLLAAPACVLLKNPRACWLLTMLVMLVSLGIAGYLVWQTSEVGVISYAIGGWAAPWGIEYRVDTLSSYVLLIITVIGALVMPFAARSVADEINVKMQYLFYAAFLLCYTGMLGITITGDAFNLFVFLEISSLSSYALVSLGKDHRALSAAYQYLIMGTLGATFYLIGVGLLYMMTGTLNMADLAERLPAVNESRTVLTALAFLTVGISLKLALFPLHSWLPNAYTYAPSAVSALLAGTATKVAAYVLLRVLFTIFGVEFVLGTMPVAEIVMILAMAAILIGSMVAVFQENLKRLLAYSSIAQIGYIVTGISLGTVTGLTAGLVHLFNHAIIKSALFMAIGCIVYRLNSVLIGDIAGLGKRMPWTMAAFVAGGISLIGVPLTAGFISKWYLVLAALDKGYWPIVVVVLAGSLMAVVYIWRIVETAYFKPYQGPASISEAPLTMLIPTWLLILINFYVGIDSSLTAGIAHKAAVQLLGVAP
jgi:multicomponent Na+:H+ antiporter subunit D